MSQKNKLPSVCAAVILPFDTAKKVVPPPVMLAKGVSTLDTLIAACKANFPTTSEWGFNHLRLAVWQGDGATREIPGKATKKSFLGWKPHELPELVMHAAQDHFA